MKVEHTKSTDRKPSIFLQLSELKPAHQVLYRMHKSSGTPTVREFFAERILKSCSQTPVPITKRSTDAAIDEDDSKTIERIH